MPSWNDLGAAFNTLRELDVVAIREESEQPLTIACFGDPALLDLFAQGLRSQGKFRYGPVGLDPLLLVPFSASALEDAVKRADLFAIFIDARTPLSADALATIRNVADLGQPTVAALVYSAVFPESVAEARRDLFRAQLITIPDPQALSALDTLGAALLEKLPPNLHMSAARRLPGLRPSFSQQLINQTSFTNASYALASALPEQIPLLNIPFAAADILVLTKNQAMLVYRLALGQGAPPEFQSRIAEVLPVIGGAFAWRQLARTIVGLIPIWGVVPKVAIAYAGTYSTGVAAWRWFADGELVSGEKLKVLTNDAMRIGKDRAKLLIDAARDQGSKSTGKLRSFGERVLSKLPGRKPKTDIPNTLLNPPAPESLPEQE